MAINNTLVKTTLLLDGKEPEQVLKELSAKANKLEKDIAEALNAGDTKKLKEVYKEYNAIQKQANQVKSATFDVQKVLNNLNGASLKDLKKVAASLNKEIDGMTFGTKEFVTKSQDLQKVRARMNEISTAVKGVDANHKGFFARAGDGFNRYFALASAMVASFAGIVIGIRKAIDMADEFEQSLANLSALTGLVGEDLKWMGDKAKELSISTTDSGVKITKSAVDILEGFKLMGSARPDLLKNKEALAQVTENALILAEASTIEMKPAVDAVAASMNQFNLGADQSARIINALGAGSLAGSAEVADLTESMANVGTVAANSNMTLEQTIGVIETLGEKQLKGAEAGTQLKTTLISLKAAGLGYTSGVFNMRDAIVQLKAKIDAKSTALEKDTVLIDTFGKRNITVGTILVNSIDKYDSFTKAVTGTNTAFEQAIINTSTNGAKLEQAKNKAALYGIELGEKLTPIMTFSTNVMGKFLRLLSASIEFYTENAKVINTVIVGIVTYTAAIKAAELYTTIYTNGIKKLLKGIKDLTVAQKANIWALVVAGITAIAYAFYELSQNETLEMKQAKMLADVHAEVTKGMVDEKLELQKLLIVAKDRNRSDADREAAINKLKEISPEYLGILTKENIATMEGTKALDLYIESLKRKHLIEVLEKKINEESDKITDIKNSKLEDNIKWYEKLWNSAKYGSHVFNALEQNDLVAINNKNKALQEELKIQEDLEKQFKDAINNASASEVTGDPSGPKEGDVKDGMVFKNGEWVSIKIKQDDDSNKEKRLKGDMDYMKSKSVIYSDWANKEKESIEKNSDDYLLNLGTRLVKERGLVEQSGDDEEKIRLARLEHEYQLEKDQVAKLQLLKEQSLISQSEYEDRMLQLRLDRLTKEIDQVINFGQSALSSYSKVNSAIKSKDDKKLAGIQANHEKEKKSLQEMYDKGAISKDEYDQRILSLDKKFDTETKQMQSAQAKREQELAIFEQSIATAVAIANAIKLAFSRSATVWDAAAGAALALGEILALMVTASSYQKPAPEFAGGNLAEVIGAQTGNSYKNVPVEPYAQNKIYSRPTLVGGKLVGETGPELVLNPPTTRNLFMNYPAITRAIQTAYAPAYATGNMQDVAGQYNSNQTINAAVDMSETNALLKLLIQKSNAPVKAYMTMKDFKTVSDLQTEIENSVRR